MKRFLIGSIVLVSLALPSFGAPVFFTDRASFEAAIGGPFSTESFENPFDVAPSIDLGDFTATESNGINNVANSNSNTNFTGAVTDGTGSLWFDDNDNSLLTFVFDFPLQAFGVDVASNTAGLMTVGGDISTSFGLLANQPQFFGVIDTTGSFSTIVFDMAGGPNYGFDRLSYAQSAASPVPEPSTWSMMALAGLALVRLRKRRV